MHIVAASYDKKKIIFQVERHITVPLSGLQRFLYAALLKKDLGQLVEAGAVTGGIPVKMPEYSRLNGLVMQLRKVCNSCYSPLRHKLRPLRRNSQH
jgi:SNF2 family DNA or RNA helicase